MNIDFLSKIMPIFPINYINNNLKEKSRLSQTQSNNKKGELDFLDVLKEVLSSEENNNNERNNLK